MTIQDAYRRYTTGEQREMEHMKPRWVKRRNCLLQRKTDRVTWVVYKVGIEWEARDLLSRTGRIQARFRSKREAKLWVQREERVWP